MLTRPLAFPLFGSQHGAIPAHEAVYEGHVDVLRMLIANGGVVNAQDSVREE